jgi:TonB family protein
LRDTLGRFVSLSALAAMMIFCVSTSIAQQNSGAAQSGLQVAGQQAITALLKQVVINPTVLVESTGKPLPSNGSWSVGKDAPASCPQTTDTCVRILYRVPDAHISCEWVVRLVRDGTDGIILGQNEDASRYLLRKISVEQANLVIPGKQPNDPAIAGALRVEGSVVVRVFVSKTGAVEKAFVISGPEMLRASAMDALNGWTFKPFVVGTQAVPFETEVTFKVRTYAP